MSVGVKTRTLQESGLLDFSYRLSGTKVRIETATLRTESLVRQFPLSHIWINQQPAAHVKGFKGQMVRGDAPLRAEVSGDRLHLFSQTFASVKITVAGVFPSASQERVPLKQTFDVSPRLKVEGLYLMVEDQLKRSDFEIYNPETRASLEVWKSSTLEECNITDTSMLTVVDKKNEVVDRNNGGEGSLELGSAKLPFVNFSEEKYHTFSQTECAWRMIGRGLNLTGKCTNEKCDAYNRTVCDPKGMGTFLMHTTCGESTCPCCTKGLSKVTNCIFWDCFYTVSGLVGNTDFSPVTNKRAPSDKAVSFVEITNQQNNIVRWDLLKITCTPVSSICTLL